MKIKLLLLSTLLLVACSPAENNVAAPAVTNEPAADWNKGAMVAAANPHAVDAAITMLTKGGHAVDAAIAAHAVLGLVEPQSSGIGGGGFMLVYERDSNSLVFHDGREQAPAGATVDMFMRDGVVMDFVESWQSGLSVGAPGIIAMYEAAHKEHGKLAWKDLFEPAIGLAERGFIVSPRLAGFLPRIGKYGRLDENPPTAAYFFPEGKPLQAGDLRKNPEYADTLRRIAQEGAIAFYQGDIAQQIARAAQAPPNAGTLTTADLASYRAIRRDAICGDFREDTICTTTPPSSGGAQIMIAVLYDYLSRGATNQAEKISAFVDAQRLAYADRDHFFGDPDAIDIPLQDLLDPAYLEHRAQQRTAPSAMPEHGDPGAFFKRQGHADQWAIDTTEEVPGTTHLSIIDAQGNAVALTASVEAPFGSSRWAGGFLLNNQLTDFARDVTADGKPVANAIAPGRRPRSSMSPTMIFGPVGGIRMVTGSPGGNSIPAYVAKTIIGVLDWNLTAQQAVDFPNLVARGQQVRVEVSVEGGQVIADDLKAKGYDVQERDGENSGLHVIVVGPEGLDGAADKRREGAVGSLPIIQ